MMYFLIHVIVVLLVVMIIQYRKYLNIKFMLRRTNEINNRMMNISDELSRFSDIDILYKKLLQETINLIEGAECGSVLVYNKEKDYMDYKACIGYDESAIASVHLKKEELFLYESTKLMAPGIIANPLLYDRDRLEKHNFEDLVNTKALEIKASLSAPLYIDGDFFGMVNVDSKTNVDAFKKTDIKLITYISKELEIAIKNAKLMNELVDALRIDKLTGIYNRRYFEEIMDKILSTEDIGEQRFTVVMIDLDDFKIINDTYGHKMGDRILKYYASVLIKSIRDGDMAIRYAGDEFVLFLNRLDEEGARGVIDRIRRTLINTPFNNIGIEFSAGVCEYKQGMNLDRIITMADNDMYRDKRARKMR